MANATKTISTYDQITALPGSKQVLQAPFTPLTSSLPVVIGDMAIDSPTDFRVRFNRKGSDGQVRNFIAARYNFATNSLAIGDVGEIFHDGANGHAAWNTVVIGQFAAGGVGTEGVHTITDTVVIGATAGALFRHGNGNVMVGNLACASQAECQHQTACGDSVWRFLTSGGGNTGIGYTAGQELVTGSNNVFAGHFTGCYASTAEDCVMIGSYAGAGVDVDNTAALGTFNIGIGSSAFRYGGLTASHNIALGNEALVSCKGSHNISMGYRASNQLTHANATKNIHLGSFTGSQTGFQKVDAINQVLIGYNIYSTVDNQVIIGNSDVTSTILRGVITGPASVDFTTSNTVPLTGPGIANYGGLCRVVAGSGYGMQLQITDQAQAKSLLSIDTSDDTFLNRNLIIKPSSSITLATNGQLTLEATSNTSCTIKYRGSDGTTRTNVLTLS